MTIAANLAAVRHRVEEACRRAGRDPRGVELIAVAKNFPAAAVNEASAAGQRSFGENRVQEAREKIPGTVPDLNWHLIGKLQKNKVKDAVRLFTWVQTVDSFELGQALDERLAGGVRASLNVLVQVKLAPEESKQGVAPEDAPGLVSALAGLPRLRVRGLMTIPPLLADPEEVRPFFRRLAVLAREIRAGWDPGDFDQLSMGMSNDFAAAVEEGATMIRVGRAIFGDRPNH